VGLPGARGAPSPPPERPPAQNECSLCCDRPRNAVLACGHPFCRECVEAWVAARVAAHGGRAGAVPCPTCRQPLVRVSPLFL
jgi:hypothetical protein